MKLFFLFLKSIKYEIEGGHFLEIKTAFSKASLLRFLNIVLFFFIK